jgi:hypothetical protein
MISHAVQRLKRLCSWRPRSRLSDARRPFMSSRPRTPICTTLLVLVRETHHVVPSCALILNGSPLSRLSIVSLPPAAEQSPATYDPVALVLLRIYAGFNCVRSELLKVWNRVIGPGSSEY